MKTVKIVKQIKIQTWYIEYYTENFVDKANYNELLMIIATMYIAVICKKKRQH